MDKETGKPITVDGKEITVSKKFTAEKSKGTVEILFAFDAFSLGDKTIVVFENLYFKERNIASHEDLKDEAQTVNVSRIPGTTSMKGSTDSMKGSTSSAVKTGDTTNIIFYIMLLIGAAIGAGYVMISRRKRTAGK